jgi:peptidoglycan-N-acetylglucosamine deacetylase
MSARRIVIAAGALCGVALVFAALGLLVRSRSVQLFGGLVSHVDTPERVVALTLDDGPVAARLDSVLGILAARRVHATFFVTGVHLAKEPETGRRLVAAGHELGNHTYTHPHLVLRAPSTIRREVERTDSLIRAAGERGPIYFRPPFGHKLLLLPYYLWRTHRTTITWDVEPDIHPGSAPTPQAIVRQTLDVVRPGSIILLHVWTRGRGSSRAALPVLIDSLHARGYRVTTVGELLAARRRDE